MGDGGAGAAGGDGVNLSHILFDNFVQATTCKGTLKAFQELCDHLEVKPNEYRVFYHKLKSKLNYWKAKALWAKLDKRASHKEYKKGRACANSKCLIIGAGPCGLRTAIELAFLGAKVVLLEKRDAFSRNNVLHLWPFTIQDLRGLGAKKFYGKFCAGAIDHISIRQLQLMLLKVALLVGIEIHVNVEFKGLIEPPEDQETERIGWRAEVHPRTHPVNELEFDVIIGADGRRNTLPGFRRKEFRGKLAIAITANFINRNTTAEAKVEEISGVAFIFNQKFFQDLREATGIDLENIVYYKDDTHYFVMTAKKQSLLEKGVILHDYADTELLLSRANVDQAALLSYAREAADFSTNHQLPTLDFAINHYGQPDVAMFDFTCMYASENAAMVRQRNGHKLLVALVGDSLLEPFWPMGTGIARGFLAAMDSGWMVKSWAQGKTPLEVLAERESIYRLLPQTTPENVSKNFSQYSVDPTTRYPNISLNFLKPSQVRHLFDTGECREIRIEIENVINSSTPKLARNDNCLLDKQLQESIARSSKLLNWCQRQTDGYRNVNVTDLTMSWKSGLALCALIHRYRPDLIDFDSLDERDQEKNNQLGFDVAEREFGISPCMTGKEMSSVVEPDKLSMVMYLSQFYEMFKDTVPPGDNHNLSPEEKAALIASTKSPISFLSKLGQSIAISRKRNPKDKKEKDVDGLGKRRKTSQSEDEEVSRSGRDDRPSVPAVLTERKMDSAAVGNNNKVKVMATQLLAKFEENAPAQPTGLKRQGESLPNLDRLLPLTPPQTPVKEPVRLAPVPAWRKRRTQQQEQLSIRYKEMVKCQTLPHRGEQARSGVDQLSSSGSRSCPKKTILLPSSSSTSSLSLHSERVNKSPDEEELEYYERPLIHGEWMPLHLADPGPIHIPGIQERAERLISRFKGKSDKPPKPKRKPSRFFVEQWYLSRGLAVSPGSSLSSHDSSTKEPTRPLESENQTPLYVLSIQERAEQLVSQFEGKPARPQPKKKPSRFFMEQWHLARAQSPPDSPPSTSDTLRQRYVRMYTGGVSSLAEQIANQLQSKEDPKPPHAPEKKDLGSLRKEFPVNIGGSDVCFFCRKRVYVMERLSAEGKFFHRSCFKCDYCGTTLRLSSYAFDVEDGKFYCKPHYCYRLSGYAQRKRPAPSPAPITAKENQTAQTPTATVDAPGRAMAAAAPSAELQPSVPEVNGLQEPSLAKRLRGTPERIELENYRLSLQREEELEEVPEETLAEHNLSSVLDKVTDADLGSSSSESDMEEEDEQEDQEEGEVEEHLPSPSDLGGVPWKEAVELHAKLRGEEGDDEAQADDVSRDGELDEEEEEEDHEEDEEEEEESSDAEGDYCPWDRELQSGLWLEKYLTDEEDVGTFKARNLQLQQVLQPVDPNAIPGLVRPHLDSEGDKEGQLASASQLSQPSELTQPSSTAAAHTSARHEAVRVWLESLSGEPCEDEELEAEADSPDIEPGTEMDQDDIPSDAEAEARLHQSENNEAPHEEDKKSESLGMASSIEPSSINPVQKEDIVLSPIQPSPEPETQITPMKSPGARFFTDPFIPEETKPEKTTPSPVARSPISPSTAPVHIPSSVPSPALAAASPVSIPASPLPASPLPASPLPASPVKSPVASPVQPANESPARSPIKSSVSSPICSQPTPLPETCAPKSPVYPHRSICPLTGNPLSPICAQPLPCHEPSSPLTSDSPVRTQPVPAVTSTPMTKTDKTTPEASKSEDSSTEETPSKKTDIIEEFWLKSAEIRKSLGLSPLDRSSKILEKSIVKTPPQESTPAKMQTPDVYEEPKPAFTGRSVIRRINITLEGQVITPLAPAEAKSDGSDKRDISSSSGLGLNGSMATSQTVNSDSYNTSDSTMLTPPSSPPPPVPANQSPAVLRQQRHQVSWSNGPEKPPPERAKEPAKTKTPVPAPRTQLSPVSAPRPAPRKVSSPQETPETTPVVVMREKKKPRPEEVRKSFVETVEEIPFADDVEETYDERTPETSMNRYYTPPTSKPNREKPPLHLALAMENGKPNIPANPAVKTQRATQFSLEAKEIAEERIRAREKSVKSQVLKDAMAKQLNKMKESDTDKGASPKVAWSVTPDASGKSKKSAGSPKTSAVKALESKKGETLPERFFSSNKSLDSSVASSDGSSASKSKKRSSLFSPRKNKKEKKAKNDSSRISGADETPPKHKSLWKAVFSGYKKDKKKKEDKSCPSTPSSSSTTQDSAKKRTSPLGRSSDLKSRRNLSFSEDSDLSCDDVLERSSQKSKADRHMDIFDLVSGMQKEAIKEERVEKERRRELKEKKRVKERHKEREREKEVEREKEKDEEESVYVPHALAFKRSYATKKTYTEEELNAKLTRRVQKAARRQAKQEELKRLHRAQIIQRQLEQVEEKQRQLEERGVAVEKALRGEAGLYKGTYTLPKQHKRRSDYWGDSNYSEILDLHLGVEPFVEMPRRRPLSFCPCCSPEGMGKKDDPKLMQEWFKLVQEKNALVRYESELMIFARELELEDRQSRLQQELRERMAVEDHLKTEKELAQEKQILNEMLEVVEQRDALVALLDEQRLREKEEDKDLEAVMLSKGFNLNWA
ncbi:protein-methionine sulfoxide oxidase mical3a isoform X1 [Amphiprion ocellaris]|uniref:protein-methionine sulfoxide oxidase mical3a isoform X1 n=1 Tax=Amphiprion ocellaris TaxID=80972 RepID=UPI00241161AF|nr:protein-methionine sulfoxide oxidase mical3a isoform X1 [Amphiprion ocellaris]XP_054864844.1 protein-methionine sulfoxide oxidase mical3a isoform X1 [Amphiprion ocellaris]